MITNRDLTQDDLDFLPLPSGTYARLLTGTTAHTNHPISAVVVWSDLPSDRCGGCGQHIGCAASCPVILDTQPGRDDVQVLDHQHGCGTWNLPGYTALGGDATVADVLDAANALAAERAEEGDAEVQSIRAGLRAELAEALARLAEPLADGETIEDREEEVITSDGYTRPGVCRHLSTGEWCAWASDPTDATDVEGIVVTEDDLTRRTR